MCIAEVAHTSIFEQFDKEKKSIKAIKTQCFDFFYISKRMHNSSSVRRVTLDQAKIIKAKKDNKPHRFLKTNSYQMPTSTVR